MLRTRRLLAGVAAMITVSLVATGCDSSPFAASINGQVIKQTALNAELRQFAGNSYYVKLAKDGEDVFAKPVTVAGSADGDYSSTWTAKILTDMVIGAAVHQHLERTHHLPGGAQLAATRAVDSVLYGPGAWDRFSPSFRTTIVGRDADLAMVMPDLVTAAQLSTVRSDYPTQLISDVCVRTVAVDVSGANGSVDYPAALGRAKAVASAIDASGGSAGGGSVTCYTAAQLETQTLGYVLEILDLRTGTAATPKKTAGGYEVTAIASRTLVALGSPLAQAFSVAVVQSRGATAAVLGSLLTGDRVKVNPDYGVWSGGGKVPFGVVSPRAPGAAPS